VGHSRQPDIIATSPLLLLEAEEGGEGPFNPDGTINVAIIRPGQAMGKGRRVYPREVLEADHKVFEGWPMFDNHESPAVRKARQGLPRATSELRGEIRETRWDPDFTHPDDAKNGFERGAVIGRAALTPFMRELVEAVPNSIKLSVRAFATGLKQGNYRGRAAELVEGFEAEDGSVDFVTRAGAGGHVLTLMESGYDREHGDAERTLEEVADEDLLHHLREHRPYLLESAPPPPDPEDDSMTDVKPGITLEEAMAAPEFKTALHGVIAEEVKAQVASEREVIEAEVRSESNRQIEIRDLHTEARRLIEESKLPPTFQDDLRLRYRLIEESDGSGRLAPSPALDVVAEKDAEGTVTKPARQVLQEALEADITRERAKLAEARPTRVTGQGASGQGDGDGASAPVQRRASFADGLRKAGVQTDRSSDSLQVGVR